MMMRTTTMTTMMMFKLGPGKEGTFFPTKGSALEKV